MQDHKQGEFNDSRIMHNVVPRHLYATARKVVRVQIGSRLAVADLEIGDTRPEYAIAKVRLRR